MLISNKKTAGKNSKGFTLIELLVSIAIIGILLSVVLVSLSSTREKSRDTKRKTDLVGVQSALELYYSAKGGYPMTDATGCTPSDQSCSCGSELIRSGISVPANWFFSSREGTAQNVPYCTWSKGVNWVPNLVASKYLSILPKDPRNNVNVSVYFYSSNKNDYKLMAGGMETDEGKNWAKNDGGNANRSLCTSDGNCYYELFSPGAQTW